MRIMETVKKVGFVYGYAAGLAVLCGLVFLFITGCQEQNRIEQLNVAKEEGQAFIVESKEGSEWYAKAKNNPGAVYFTDEDVKGNPINVGDVVWVVTNKDGTEIEVTGDF